MRKKGISLIALIITIIIIVILAGTVLLSLIQSSPIGQANEAKFKNDTDMFNSELMLYTSNKILETKGNFDMNSFDADNNTAPSISDIITSMEGKKYENLFYTDIFEIEKGKLILKETIADEHIIGWLDELGIGTGTGEGSIPNEIERVESTSDLWEFDTETQTISRYLGTDLNVLTTITIPNYIDGIQVINITGTEYSSVLGNIPYQSPLREVIISEGIQSIRYNSFYYCSALTSISLPNTITTIEDRAFYYCSNLTSILIPKSVSYIGYEVFMRCSKLTNIDVSSSNMNYASIDGVLFNKNITNIIRYPEGKSGTIYSIPGTVTNVSNRAFYLCTALTNITIPSSVTSIGEYSLSRCDSLTSLILPNSITSIAACTFWNSIGLTDVTIPESVTSIGASAFKGCISLASVTLPNSVTTLENEVFNGCSSLISIHIGDSLSTIGNNVFDHCSSLVSFDVSLNNLTYSSSNGILFNKDNTKLVRYPQGKPETSYEITNNITSLEKFAFYYCTNLQTVTIPTSMTSIAESAFEGSGLIEVSMPNTITYIGQSAFSRCTSLLNVTIPGSITGMGMFAFIYSYNIQNITIEQGVQQIGHYAFSSCREITTITIPSSVTWMGIHIFSSCNKLEEIIINKPAGSISGERWSAPASTVITWTG